MLTFSAEQLDEFERNRGLALRLKMVAMGRSDYAERCKDISNQQLRQAADRIVGAASRVGMVQESGYLLFFKIALCWGIAFLDNPSIAWTQPITRHPDEPAEEWLERVEAIALATAKRDGRWTWQTI